MSYADAEEQQTQEGFRSWDEALSILGPVAGRRVLDLGCGIGTFTARLAAAGAHAIGVDADPQLIARARALHPGIRFEPSDVRMLRRADFGPIDGAWSAFVAAFFGDLTDVLRSWSNCLDERGWLALVEIDDLLGHEPMDPSTRAEIDNFYATARAAGGYDFLAGRKLASALRDAGLVIERQSVLPDRELSFTGPASADVEAAWRRRFARMKGLRAHVGDAAAMRIEGAVLAALRSAEHTSRASVRMVVARRGG